MAGTTVSATGQGQTGHARRKQAEPPKARAHFFNSIEEDKLKAFGQTEGTSKGGATDNSGDLITRLRCQLHLPPQIIFSDGCTRLGALSGINFGSYLYLYHF